MPYQSAIMHEYLKALPIATFHACTDRVSLPVITPFRYQFTTYFNQTYLGFSTFMKNTADMLMQVDIHFYCTECVTWK